MARAAFGFLNWIASGTLSDSSHATGFGAANLAGPTLFPGWQSAAAVTTAHFDCDAGAAVAWDCIGLFGCNFDPGAGTTVQIALGSSAGNTDVYNGSAVAAGVAPGYRQTVTVLPSTKTARYLRVTVVDSGNPDTFLHVGMVFGGPLWTPGRNFSYGEAAGWQDDSTFQVSKGGQEYQTILPKYRVNAFKFDNLTEAEKFADVAEIDRLASTYGNVLFLPDPAGTYLQQEALFGRIAKSAAPVRTFTGRYSKTYQMRERL